MATENKNETWPLLLLYITERQQDFFSYANKKYIDITDAFISDNARKLSKTESSLFKHKTVLKNARRKETLCLRQLPHETAIEKSPWFYLSNNCCLSVLYNLRRITEVCREHVDNNFLPLPNAYAQGYEAVNTTVKNIFDDLSAVMQTNDPLAVTSLRQRCDKAKDLISATYHGIHDHLHEADSSTITVLYVYVNMLQETQELASAIRKYLRAFAKLRSSDYRTRH